MTTTTRRAATATTALVLALAATLALAGTADATRRGGEATTHRHTTTSASWIHPPTPTVDTFANIYGSRSDGYIADHTDDSLGHTIWVNTLYPPAREILFGYCPSGGRGDHQVYLCQTAWDEFYRWMRAHRDGTKQDWIDQQYPTQP